MATVDIVCTTIGDGSFLVPYAQEIAAAKAQDRVRMIVIPDRKTPMALYEAADALRPEITIECPDVIEQESFLAKLGADGMFPLDSDGRRNIGYLMAYEHGADIMISIDDDNLPQPGWLREHEIVVAPPAEHMMAGAGDGTFWDPCSELESTVPVYARGFPYSHRWEFALHRRSEGPCEVSINEGLWIGDPDVDAITRLAVRPKTTGLRHSRVLNKGTWAPVNSQNTAVRREVIPAYCYFEPAKRFADIWQGYFAQACAKHLGHHVRFGTPAANCAVRNNHDLLHDLSLEYDGIMMLDQVLDWLTELKLTGATYIDAYEDLEYQLRDYIYANDLPVATRMTLKAVAERMRQWLKVIKVMS